MTRQEAINTGKGLARTYLRRGGAAFLVIGRWEDNGEYWCQAGARTEKAANEKRAQIETDMDNHPCSATFEVVAI